MNQQNLNTVCNDNNKNHECCKRKSGHQNPSLTDQLEKLNKIRESIYSVSGWGSQNVNQSPRWLVDLEKTAGNNNNNKKEMEVNQSTVLQTKIINSEYLSCVSNCEVLHCQNSNENENLHLGMETLNLESKFSENCNRIKPQKY